MTDIAMEAKNIVRAYELLTKALAARANAKEYYEVKKRMSQVEISALKRLQQSRSLANYQTNKANGRTKKRGSRRLDLPGEPAGLLASNSAIDIRPQC
jgi:hypothetical protein